MKARLTIALLVCAGVVVLVLKFSQSSAPDTATQQEASTSAPAIPPQQPAPAKASADGPPLHGLSASASIVIPANSVVVFAKA